MTEGAPTPMRSWLFAPGDSERKTAKAIEGAADVVILDLEDAVAPEAKANARTLVRAALDAAADRRARIWVRINPLDGPHALADLAVVVAGRPAGIMLPKARGRYDVEALDHYLSVLEVAAGIERGSIEVAALVTETAQGVFATGEYAGAPRLTGISWGAEDLADALGAQDNRTPDGDYAFTYQLARSLCLVGAAAAGVAAIETIHGDFRDEDGLRRRAEQARRDGFRGMLAIHPAQVEVINAAFSPNEQEIADARAIVDLFAANPGVGTIGHKGAMLDRPHLARAQALLRLAGRTAQS